jgi:hypothetical protein
MTEKHAIPGEEVPSPAGHDVPSDGNLPSRH